jgi:hypothetical protein
VLEQSDAVKQAWQASERTLDIVINVDGQDYQATSINSLSYDAGAFTGDSLGIGSNYENSISAEFSSVIEAFAAGQVVKPKIGIKVNGTFEYTPLGVFIISEVNRDRNNSLTTIKALDQMVKLERAYTSTLTYPATMLDVIAEIANQGGVTVNQTDLTHLPSLPKLNSAITGQTLRTAIGWIAQFYAGFAAFDRNGQLTIRTTATPDYVINPSEYMQGGLTKNEVTYKAGGIKVSVTTTSTTETGEKEDKTTTLQAGETSGSQIELTNNVMTSDALSTIWTGIKDISFYPYSLNWFGNPGIEAGDWVTLTDTQGNKFNVPINQLAFTFNGGLESTISASQASQSSTVTPWTGPTQNAIEQANTRKTATGNNVYDPSFTSEPKNAKIGDVWFKQNGNNVELWTYSRDSSGNASWQKRVVDGEAKADVEKATSEAKAYSDSVKSQIEADAAKTKAELDSDISEAQTAADAAKATASNAINYYKEQYYVSTSYTQITGGSWSDTPPGKVKGKYIWIRYITNNANGSQKTSTPYCISGLDGENGVTGPQGPQGVPGKAGADGKTPYVHIAYANSADGSTDFNTDYFDNALYVGVYTDYSLNDSGDNTKYTWSRLKGNTGATGATGYYMGNDAPPNPTKGSVWATPDANGNVASAKVWNGSSWVQAKYSAAVVADDISANQIKTGILNANQVTIANADNAKLSTGVSIGSKFTQIEQDASGIKGRVGNAEGRLATVEVTANGVKTTVEKMQVGGRNLVLGTQKAKAIFDDATYANINDITLESGYYWPDCQHVVLKEHLSNLGLTYNDTLTVTGALTISKNGTLKKSDFDDNFTLGLFRTTHNWLIHAKIGKEDLVDGQTTYKVKETFVIGNSEQLGWESPSPYFWLNMAPTGYSISVNHYQVEKGNVATDWSPAPEDAENEISQVDQKANQITNYVQKSNGSGLLATLLNQSASNASLSALVNGQVVSAINVSSSGDALIAGKKIMLDGDVTITGAAFAKKLKATGITVDQLVAGSIDASKINVINLNANNITAGTINGNNLSINLDNGQVAFTKGSLHSTDGMFNIDLDNKFFQIQPNNGGGLWIDNNGFHYKANSTSDLWINKDGFHNYTSSNPNGTWIKDDSLTNADSSGQGVTFKNGNVQFSKLPYWSSDSSKVYGSISRDADIFSASKDGLRITGRDGVTIYSGSCDADSLLTNTYGPLGFRAGSGLGLSDDVNYASYLYSNSTLYLSAGPRYPINSSYPSGLDAQPTISVGTGEYYNHSGAWMFIPANHDSRGNSVSVHAANFNVTARDWINFEANGGNARIAFQADYIHMYPTYIKTTSAGANVYVAADGALIRSTSAAKYKTDIQPANEFADYGDKLINLTPKVWLDKAEVKRYKNDPAKNKKPGYYYGLIADELDRAGLNKLVTYGEEGQVEGIQYDRLAVALLPVIKKLKEEIQELKERI